MLINQFGGCDGVGTDYEDYWDRGSCSFRGECGSVALARDHIDLTVHEIGSESGQPIVIPLRPAVLDYDILSFDSSG